MNDRHKSGARSVARKLLMQALYEWQLNHQPWQDLYNQYLASEDMKRADPQYFRELIEAIVADHEDLDRQLQAFVDRPLEGLDPIEHAVLLIGLYELRSRPEVPYRVAISEGVGLTKRFGATDGHKFVNAVLDKAATALRHAEH